MDSFQRTKNAIYFPARYATTYHFNLCHIHLRFILHVQGFNIVVEEDMKMSNDNYNDFLLAQYFK